MTNFKNTAFGILALIAGAAMAMPCCITFANDMHPSEHTALEQILQTSHCSTTKE